LEELEAAEADSVAAALSASAMVYDKMADAPQWYERTVAPGLFSVAEIKARNGSTPIDFKTFALSPRNH
jgi:hypothetical protein